MLPLAILSYGRKALRLNKKVIGVSLAITEELNNVHIITLIVVHPIYL